MSNLYDEEEQEEILTPSIADPRALPDQELLKHYFQEQQARQAQLAEAEERAAENRFTSQIAQAGAGMGHAIAKAPGQFDASPFQQLQKGAEQPLEQVARQQKGQAEQKKILQDYLLKKYQIKQSGDLAKDRLEVSRDRNRITEQGNEATNALRAAIESRTAGHQAQVSADRATERAEKKANARKAIEVPGFDIQDGQLPSEKDGNDLKMVEIARRNIEYETKQLEKLLQSNGPELGFGDAHDQMKAHKSQIVSELKNLEKLGVLAGPDMALLGEQIPDPTSVRNWLKWNSKGKLSDQFSSFKKSLGEKVKNEAEVRGYRSKTQLAPADPESESAARKKKIEQLRRELGK